MTYGAHIQHLKTLISALTTAQTSAAYWGLQAAARSIDDARQQLIKDMNRACEYADKHMAHGQEIA